MGFIPEGYQSVVDESDGVVDLAQFEIPPEEEGSIIYLNARTVSGIWYNLSSMPETKVSPKGAITPLELRAFSDRGSASGEPYQSAFLGIRAMKNWAIERRHFPRRGNVSVVCDTISRGDRIRMNGYRTGRLATAFVTTTHYVDGHSDSPTSLTKAYFGEHSI